MDDGGMQWFAQIGQWEQERREEEAKRMSAAIEDHRKWKENFNRGLTPTKPKNADNETKEQTT